MEEVFAMMLPIEKSFKGGKCSNITSSIESIGGKSTKERTRGQEHIFLFTRPKSIEFQSVRPILQYVVKKLQKEVFQVDIQSFKVAPPDIKHNYAALQML